MIWFTRNFNPLKPRRGVAWTEVSFTETIRRIGGEDALVAWDRDVTQTLVPNRTWATAYDEGGGCVWLSKTVRRSLPIVDAQHVWTYARPTDAAPIGAWSSTAFLNTLLDQVVFDVGVPTRGRTSFSNNNILFVGELVSRSPDQLLAMYNLGKTTLHGIERSLAKQGLKLGMDVSSWTSPLTALTWPEPAPGPYDVTFNSEIFYWHSCSWLLVQYRIIRPPPDGEGYAIRHRSKRYVSRWDHRHDWADVLRLLNYRRWRNVRVVESEPLIIVDDPNDWENA